MLLFRLIFNFPQKTSVIVVDVRVPARLNVYVFFACTNVVKGWPGCENKSPEFLNCFGRFIIVRTANLHEGRSCVFLVQCGTNVFLFVCLFILLLLIFY